MIYLHRFLKQIFTKNYFGNIRYQILILLLFIFVCFSTISFITCNNAIEDYRKEIAYQLDLIENNIFVSIQNGKQVLQGLAYLISKNEIKRENKRIHSIIKKFDPQSQSFKSIPFSALVIVDENYLSVACSTENFDTFKQIDFSESMCIQSLKDSSLSFNIGPITTGFYSKKLVIPLGAAMYKKGKFLGAICSGLSISSLQSYFNDIALYESFSEITLANKKNETKDKTLSKTLILKKVVNNILFDEQAKIKKSITNYQYEIIATLRLDSLHLQLKEKLKICLYYSVLFISCLLSIFIIIKRFYSSPLNSIKEMILKLPEKVLSKEISQNLLLHQSGSVDITPAILNETIAHLTKQLQTFYENQEKAKFEQYAQEIRRKVLHLALIENHYSPLEKISKAKGNALYSNFLSILVNEEPREMSLKDYFGEIINYLKEYFYELRIKLNFDDTQDRVFNFKYSALTETIFHIILFIQRSALDSDEENSEITINAHFRDQDAYPIISINSKLNPNTQKPIGWEAGAHFSYQSLFSVYLLAKENNLSFDIEEEGSEILFILKLFKLDESKLATLLYK